MARLTVEVAKQAARDAGFYLWVEKPSYARHNPKYTLYKDGRYIGCASTLAGVMERIQVNAEKGPRKGA